MFLLHCVFSVVATVVGLPFEAPPGANPLRVFLPVAITNGIAAAVACRKISLEGARWVWIPWALLIPYAYTNYPQAHTMGQHLANVWHQMFSAQCGDTECIYHLFVGMPFVGSVMYALSSLVVRWDASGGLTRMDRKRANRIERYVLLFIAAGLLLLLVALVINNPQPTRAQRSMFRLVLMLAAGAFGGTLPGLLAAKGNEPGATAKALGVIGLALTAGFLGRWLL